MEAAGGEYVVDQLGGAGCAPWQAEVITATRP